ncbi:SGNH/GDSL hydrolase family protein [Cohnella panacarvi]|uniref:SGNH/GDSL hydrolase family protein n=1 Tax=Cohnella panacarvi TaxID=400776 RepID=UPI0012EB7869|nr:SGNH/GDSL hydrolase family protein [Cohnella panacarvi]
MNDRFAESRISVNGGPTAPRDPVQRRSAFYVMYETDVEATDRGNGIHSQEVYLDNGRLASLAKFNGGIEDEGILEMLRTCGGFRKLVHSIGVTVKVRRVEDAPVFFVLENWGKTSQYETGTKLRVPCPVDGTEQVIELSQAEWSEDDDSPGKYAFEFAQPGALATVSLIFYLHDGYEVPDIEIEPPVEFGSQAYRDMIELSLLSQGNNKRLKAAIEKAKRGEEVTIAYIGGSITQGAGAKPIHTNCYAYRSYERFKRSFEPAGGGNVRFVKAGVGGTPSELGIVRYDRDITRDGAVSPDIVVVEFAVNDEGDETKGNCFESLVLNILTSPNHPAVILLFSVFINDWNLQDRLSQVGRHYGLPMVSVKDAVAEQFRLTKAEGNVISKRQFFYDIYHPTNAGHTVMADCLDRLFAAADQAEADAEDISIDKPPIIGNDFVGMRLLDRSNYNGVAEIAEGGFTETDSELQNAEMDDHPYGTPQFPYNWMRTASSGNASFKLTLACRCLILVFKDSGNGDFGKAEVIVDGKPVLVADPHLINWTHCNAVLLVRGEETKVREAEIRMAAGEENKSFTVLGFGYVE